MTRGTLAGGVLIAAMLAGCAGQSLSPADSEQPPAANAGMDGRWILAAPNAPSCGIQFNGGAGAQEAGTLLPEGGCPAHFFTSRRWALANGTLTITDDDKQPLASLQLVNGRFEGQTSAGTPVTLTPSPL